MLVVAGKRALYIVGDLQFSKDFDEDFATATKNQASKTKDPSPPHGIAGSVFDRGETAYTDHGSNCAHL